ncbi:MAG: CRISPR-associated protein Cas2 [Candidatus Nitrosocaldaceae archaeon]|nr:MAG: CRISPR-associated protein Cas2 [Candidatus Nitrosocaldaceae archaeon]
MVIIVYDVGIERLDAVRKILKQYLNWVQNSAFEGEITEGLLEEIKLKLFGIIDTEVDSIIVYSINNPKWVKKRIWGREKGETDNIL